MRLTFKQQCPVPCAHRPPRRCTIYAQSPSASAAPDVADDGTTTGSWRDAAALHIPAAVAAAPCTPSMRLIDSRFQAAERTRFFLCRIAR
jgi:hypothetical protein